MVAWIGPCLALAGCGGEAGKLGDSVVASASPGLEPDGGDYAEARSRFRTRLIAHGPSPQPSAFPATPTGSVAIDYPSSGRTLRAFASHDPGSGARSPAVLYLHGGYAFGPRDWELPALFRRAGFVVMVPTLRGENGQGGDFSLFHDELEDVLAAADALGQLAYVDPKRLYVAGHSVGGTLTLLAALASGRFRAAASFSGSPDQVAFAQTPGRAVPFDRGDLRELRIRSPVVYARGFRCPTRLYLGEEEFWAEASSALTADRARSAGLDVEAISVPGDHFSSVPEAMRRAIAFFRAH